MESRRIYVRDNQHFSHMRVVPLEYIPCALLAIGLETWAIYRSNFQALDNWFAFFRHQLSLAGQSSTALQDTSSWLDASLLQPAGLIPRVDQFLRQADYWNFLNELVEATVPNQPHLVKRLTAIAFEWGLGLILVRPTGLLQVNSSSPAVCVLQLHEQQGIFYYWKLNQYKRPQGLYTFQSTLLRFAKCGHQAQTCSCAKFSVERGSALPGCGHVQGSKLQTPVFVFCAECAANTVKSNTFLCHDQSVQLTHSDRFYLYKNTKDKSQFKFKKCVKCFADPPACLCLCKSCVVEYLAPGSICQFCSKHVKVAMPVVETEAAEPQETIEPGTAQEIEKFQQQLYRCNLCFTDSLYCAAVDGLDVCFSCINSRLQNGESVLGAIFRSSEMVLDNSELEIILASLEQSKSAGICLNCQQTKPLLCCHKCQECAYLAGSCWLCKRSIQQCARCKAPILSSEITEYCAACEVQALPEPLEQIEAASQNCAHLCNYCVEQGHFCAICKLFTCTQCKQTHYFPRIDWRTHSLCDICCALMIRDRHYIGIEGTQKSLPEEHLRKLESRLNDIWTMKSCNRCSRSMAHQIRPVEAIIVLLRELTDNIGNRVREDSNRLIDKLERLLVPNAKDTSSQFVDEEAKMKERIDPSNSDSSKCSSSSPSRKKLRRNEAACTVEETKGSRLALQPGSIQHEGSGDSPDKTRHLRSPKRLN